jgi:exosortase/archaeosortase family protein
MSYNDIIKNPGFIFIVKFLVLFLGIHYFNEFFIGITAPGGWYVSFLDHNLNYVAWLRHSILWGSKLICNLAGYDTYIDGPYHLRSVTGHGVQMVYSCIGLGIKSFWAGFVLAHNIPWKKKLTWTLIGLLVIWVINCCRVAIILIATINDRNINRFMEHHDFFNLVAYLFIFILIIIFLKKQGLHKTEEVAATS